MVPLINNAAATRWFVEDVWGRFGDDHTRPGVALLLSERKNADGSVARVGGVTAAHRSDAALARWWDPDAHAVVLDAERRDLDQLNER
jgi:hypothetical protein